MVHTLKRVYLYTAATFALLFSAGVTVNLLINLFHLAGLEPQEFDYQSGSYSALPAPTSQEVVQSVVLFVVVAVLVGLLFGGGHYWLIRRDAHSDPGADAGATRHLFLNGLMALAVLVAVPTALSALSTLEPDGTSYVDPAVPLAFALVAWLVFVGVALERARVNPAGRAATIIRQIHEDGVQAILVLIASSVLFSASNAVIHRELVQSNVVQISCFNAPEIPHPTLVPCPSPPFLGPILEAVFAVLAWGIYVRLAAWSRRAVLQRILWYAALGYGLVWLLYGVSQAIYTGAAALFGASDAWQESLNNSLPFVGALLTGALIASPYALWIRRMAAQMPARWVAIHQGLLAIPAALSLGFFLAGVTLVLEGLVEQIIPAGNRLDADGWATAVGALVAGLGYPSLWLRLRRASDPAQVGPVIPRRIYMLAALAATAIGAIIALVITVYQIVAIFLGLESGDSFVARQSAVALLALGAAALYHTLRLRADLRLSRTRVGVAHLSLAPVSPPPQAPESTGATTQEPATLAELAGAASGAPETLESILNGVAAGTLDPATAASRIRRLPSL